MYGSASMSMPNLLQASSHKSNLSLGVTQPDDPWIDTDWALADHHTDSIVVDYDRDATSYTVNGGVETGSHPQNVNLDGTKVYGKMSTQTNADDSAVSNSIFHDTPNAGAEGNHPTNYQEDVTHSSNIGVKSDTQNIELKPASTSGADNYASCYGFDDFFSYHYHAGKEFICTQEAEDKQTIHDYVTNELAMPVAKCENGEPTTSKESSCILRTSKASPSHMVLAGHACVLAAIQGTTKCDMQRFRQDAAANAEAVTPVGALLLRKYILHNRHGSGDEGGNRAGGGLGYTESVSLGSRTLCAHAQYQAFATLPFGEVEPADVDPTKAHEEGIVYLSC